MNSFFLMQKRQPSKSNWNKIIIIDENNQNIKQFELNELGQLKNKLKTQNRRKIHEGRRAKKIEDLSKTLIPKVNDKEYNQNLSFDLDVFNDQDNSIFDSFQDFSEMNKELTYKENMNESVFLSSYKIIPDFNNIIFHDFDI